MFLLGFLLIPMVLVASLEVTINNYVVNIIYGTLTGIYTTGELSDDLNLSGLGLDDIDIEVFHNISHVKNLNLGNNSLSDLPAFAFTNFTNLEYLSLADNAFCDFSDAFVGLINLKTLNISNNPIRYLKRGSFFGLSKTADILTHDVRLFRMENGLFENPSLQIDSDEIEERITNVRTERHRVKEESANESTLTKMIEQVFGNANFSALNTSLRVRLCDTEGIVTRLDVLDDDSELEYGCREVRINHKWRTVSLRQLGITGFNSGWYRLQDYAIGTLDLRDNDIVDVTGEMLNDLPEGVKNVCLINNKIKRVVGRISNQHLCHLILMNNSISEIEDGALENTKISFLNLRGNELESTRFLATLPNTMVRMDLSNNQIQELPAGYFSSHGGLMYLNLNDNNITEIKSESFEGLSSLRALSIAQNRLRNIESDSFQDLQALNTLNLNNNYLTNLDKGVFTGLSSVNYISLVHNQLTELTKDSFYGLSDTLRVLFLNFNQIETLEIGTFVNVPKDILSLDNNKISKIEKGTFDLPSLYNLYLDNNSLIKLDGDSFEGLDGLRYLSLRGNGIKKIEKGVAKNLGGLFGLSLSNNPIDRLENGAFLGLPKGNESFVNLMNVPIEVIQGGLFEDV